MACWYGVGRATLGYRLRTASIKSRTKVARCVGVSHSVGTGLPDASLGRSVFSGLGPL